MEIPCPNKIDCQGSDFPISNYSAEGGEQVPTYNSLVFPSRWDKYGCLSLCVSTISQNDADLCALAQEALCQPDPPPDGVFCNTGQTCSCVSVGGAEFFYITPAGTFCADTQEAADAQAQSYACIHCGNPQTSVQLGNLDACTCLGSEYSERIGYSGARPVSWYITSGYLPDGLTINSETGRISGTTQAAGTFNFWVRAILADGNWAQKMYTMYVLEITTDSLPNFSLGVAYSKQLEVTGGSGNYRWSIFNGSLPTGLTLSTTGLISGTPTSDDGSAAIQFSVIDTTCETLNRTNFKPDISLTTQSTTLLRTKRGYPEYVATDGTLYKKITWSGGIIQTAFTAGSYISGPEQCAGAGYLYTGSTEIDTNGNIVSSHSKTLLVGCPAPVWPSVAEGPNRSVAILFPGTYWSESRIHKLPGYCFPYDIYSCIPCNFTQATWNPYGNYQTPSPTDAPKDFLLDPAGYSKTATTFQYSGTASGEFLTEGNIASRQPDQLINISATGTYGAVLSEPYTDAEAAATQQTIISTGAVAENLPDYLRAQGQQWLTLVYTRLTTVDFTLTLSNLIVGETYLVNYDLWQNNGVVTTITQAVTATAETQNVTGTLGLPAAGVRILIKNPKIAYS